MSGILILQRHPHQSHHGTIFFCPLLREGYAASVKLYNPISTPPMPEIRIGMAVASPCSILLTIMPAVIHPRVPNKRISGKLFFPVIQQMKCRSRSQVYRWHITKHMQEQATREIKE